MIHDSSYVREKRENAHRVTSYVQVTKVILVKTRDWIFKFSIVRKVGRVDGGLKLLC